MKKHKHKWHFVKKHTPTFVPSIHNIEIPTPGTLFMFESNKVTPGHWTVGFLEFVCECGKSKMVIQK